MACRVADRSPIFDPRQGQEPASLYGAEPVVAPRRGNAARLPVNRDEERDDEDRDDVRDLDHRVDRGAGGVLVRITHRVAGDGGRVSLGALAAERAVLDRLLRVVPRTAARGHRDREEEAGYD